MYLYITCKGARGDRGRRSWPLSEKPGGSLRGVSGAGLCRHAETLHRAAQGCCPDAMLRDAEDEVEEGMTALARSLKFHTESKGKANLELHQCMQVSVFLFVCALVYLK